MKGSRPGKLPQQSQVSTSGRRCSSPGCTTSLSIYNRRPTCWQHTDIVFPNYRGKRLASEKA